MNLTGPQKGPDGPARHTLQAPSCEESQHHRSVPAQSGTEPAPYGLGREAQPPVEVWRGPRSSPEPVASRAGRGPVPSLNKVHIFHVHWGSQQSVNLGVLLC